MKLKAPLMLSKTTVEEKPKGGKSEGDFRPPVPIHRKYNIQVTRMFHNLRKKERERRDGNAFLTYFEKIEVDYIKIMFMFFMLENYIF